MRIPKFLTRIFREGNGQWTCIKIFLEVTVRLSLKGNAILDRSRNLIQFFISPGENGRRKVFRFSAQKKGYFPEVIQKYTKP